MKKFKFGKNWKNFLKVLNEKRIKEAEISLKELTGLNNLKEKTFVDIGCGSGIFSLAARNLGASVYSFDCDEEAIECAKILKNKFYKDDEIWKIEKGDILNREYVESLKKFDIIYIWGVVHHTGNMWRAMENLLYFVKNDSYLIISVYNDQ
ncbi:MAG TPA: methyltransferase domain-containing protein [bacterium]|nr:methyltransferase domain-containing protein [bacterium]HOM26749.1 methyltransferase domain-containing protein [bacterium]